jgi:putative membrane protein
MQAMLIGKKNAGPKEYLANERTFLAWIRTSIALIGLGALVVKFAYVLIGVVMVALGAVMALLAYARYRKIENQLNTNSFNPSRTLTTLITIAIVLGCIFIVMYLLPGCATNTTPAGITAFLDSTALN